MDLEQFIKNFEEAIEDMTPGTVKAETRFRELAQWDSLAHLTVISMIDIEYDVRLKSTELKECDTVASIYGAIAKKS